MEGGWGSFISTVKIIIQSYNTLSQPYILYICLPQSAGALLIFSSSGFQWKEDVQISFQLPTFLRDHFTYIGHHLRPRYHPLRRQEGSDGWSHGWRTPGRGKEFINGTTDLFGVERHPFLPTPDRLEKTCKPERARDRASAGGGKRTEGDHGRWGKAGGMERGGSEGESSSTSSIPGACL